MNDFDLVVLTMDIPDKNLTAGDVGTIVHIHDGGAAFIVEFMTYGGDTVAVVTLTREHVRMALETEIPHVRAMAS